MPKEFESCVNSGGRVRTISGRNEADAKKFGLSGNQYLKVCFRGGKMYRGEVHSYKSVLKTKKS